VELQTAWIEKRSDSHIDGVTKAEDNVTRGCHARYRLRYRYRVRYRVRHRSRKGGIVAVDFAPAPQHGKYGIDDARCCANSTDSAQLSPVAANLLIVSSSEPADQRRAGCARLINMPVAVASEA
jgi:hypothetical protein